MDFPRIDMILRNTDKKWFNDFENFLCLSSSVSIDWVCKDDIVNCDSLISDKAGHHVIQVRYAQDTGCLEEA
jgi:hypothetical protein